MNDFNDFDKDQWWMRELDSMVVNGTDDQKRAMAVVHNLLLSVKCYEQVAIVAKAPMVVTIGWIKEVPHNTKLYAFKT